MEQNLPEHLGRCWVQTGAKHQLGRSLCDLGQLFQPIQPTQPRSRPIPTLRGATDDARSRGTATGTDPALGAGGSLAFSSKGIQRSPRAWNGEGEGAGVARQVALQVVLLPLLGRWREVRSERRPGGGKAGWEPREALEVGILSAKLPKKKKNPPTPQHPKGWWSLSQLVSSWDKTP